MEQQRNTVKIIIKKSKTKPSCNQNKPESPRIEKTDSEIFPSMECFPKQSPISEENLLTSNDEVRRSLTEDFDVSPKNTSVTNIHICKNNSTKTKKKQKILSKIEKTRLWQDFDTDKRELECVWTNSSENNLTKSNHKDMENCCVCSANLIITEDGFPTCTNKDCGHINVNTLDYSPEWRFYGADDKNQNDPTRCGNPINPLLIESSFGCKVLVSNSSTYEMRKIRKWTEWQSMPHKEKSLYDEFQFITIMAQNAGIPKIFIDDAIIIHKDISEQKMFRGMNRDGIKSASIYISCRLNGCPRTAHEIAEIFRLDKTSATAGCSMAVKILHNIERNFDPSQQTELGSTKPIAFIERFCSRLNVNGELTMLSKFIAKKVEDQCIINNNTPHAVAAGILFFISNSCNLDISKTDIKAICGVSEVTINKCFKKLEIIKQQLIPSCILEKYT
jgi:transcription initiation factor TFIIB